MSDRILAANPLFTLGHPVVHELALGKVFTNWPPEHAAILHAAQGARDELIAIMRDSTAPQRARLAAANKYLPYALAIEEIKARTPTMAINERQRFHWTQSPIVVAKYRDRFFDGRYFSVEVLHVVWMRAIILLNLAFTASKDGDILESVAVYREIAGIFHFLASDRLRVVGAEQVPIEFQPAVFNSLMTLSLGQAYSLIAGKAEADGSSFSVIGKLSYSISSTFSSALEAIQGARPEGTIEAQYQAWLQGAKIYYHALSAVGLGKGFKAAEEYGRPVGMLRLAIDDLGKIPALHKANQNLIDAAAALLAKIKPLEAAWGKDNAMIAAEPVPSLAEADQIVSSSALVPNLPQPTPYSLPAPAGAAAPP